MKYHAIPTPRYLPKDTSRDVRHSVHHLTQELVSILAKLTKKDRTNCPVLFYLHDRDSMCDLVHRLKDGDELFIHAEGNPFIIGPVESGPYVLTPFQLASLLDENRLPDLNINILLLSCNSATDYDGHSFSFDMSKALSIFFRYRAISVTGYTGFIEVKSNAKFSVSSVLGRSTKGTHSDLDSAKIVYKNGQVCFHNKVLIETLSMMGFDWAEPYINQTNRERRLVDTIQQTTTNITPRVARDDLSLHHFFSSGKNKPTAKLTATASVSRLS